MNELAIQHIPLSQDAHGINEHQVVFRLRAEKGDILKCTLFFGDRACRTTPIHFSSADMRIVARDLYFDYFEVVLDSPYKRICYYFQLFDGEMTRLYYGDFFSDHLVDDRSEYFQLPFNHRADLATVPEWVKDAVVYNIFPDSFATAHRMIDGISKQSTFNGLKVNGKLGGTIKGITENVDYLVDLGVNCIYINPIFAAGEYHKYDLIDYYHIDPVFGTNVEFKEMVAVYHENGIKVIIDGVFNHCGWQFFAFEDVVKNGRSSKYVDWFYGLEFPVVRPDNWVDYPNYECFGYERMMPKLNTANPEVVAYFMDVCAFWIKTYDIDGWRLDVASECNDAFWRAFREVAKAIKPECIIIGEVWESAQHWLDGSLFDSTMNYDFRKHSRRFFAERSIDASEFDARVTHMLMRYRKNMVFGQLNLLDSHDVSRFLSLCGGDRRRYKLAILFMMTFVGMPTIFYGDEQGIEGVLEAEYRKAMAWDAHDGLHCYFKALIQVRKSSDALKYGTFETIFAAAAQHTYIYKRVYGQEEVIVAINMSYKSVVLPVNVKVKLQHTVGTFDSDTFELSPYGGLIGLMG